MFLMDRRNKMFRKIAIIIAMFFLCLGLDNCGGIKVREDFFEHRYNVEVIYTNVAEGGSNVTLYYVLYDPTASGWGKVPGSIIMNKIEGNKARCYLPKVFIQHENGWDDKHTVSVVDENVAFYHHTGENIDIQGAYDLEIESVPNGTRLKFKMSMARNRKKTSGLRR